MGGAIARSASGNATPRVGAMRQRLFSEVVLALPPFEKSPQKTTPLSTGNPGKLNLSLAAE